MLGKEVIGEGGRRCVATGGARWNMILVLHPNNDTAAEEILTHQSTLSGALKMVFRGEDVQVKSRYGVGRDFNRLLASA